MPQNRGGERERDRDRDREIEQGKRLKPYREKCYRNEIEGGGKSFPLRGERGGEGGGKCSLSFFATITGQV